MQVIRAAAWGFCFGVRDALHIAAAIEDPAQVTIHGELVHNESVLVQLDRRGIRRQPEHDRSLVPDTPVVLITAHGISERERRRLTAAGKRLIDTTCPLVERAHAAARRLAAEGRFLIVVGRPGHVEVRGIIEDAPRSAVIEDVHEVRTWPEPRLGIVFQTTTPPETAERVVAAVREQNPQADVRVIDTICQPTRDRQAAVEALLDEVDAMVVVGGRRSNNTRALVERCRRRGVTAFHVQGPDDLDREALRRCARVGLTAGTSTPDADVDAVERTLLELPDGNASQKFESRNPKS